MDSGSTDFTVALVPTAMKAGVWISPCGVVMVPVRPRNAPPLASSCPAAGLHVSVRRLPTRKENSDCRPAGVSAEGEDGSGLAGTVQVCQLTAVNLHWRGSDVG